MPAQLTMFDQKPKADRKPYRSAAQWRRVLNYMQRHGWITSFIASRELGVSRCAARIEDIEADGWIVDDEWIYELNRFNQKCRVKKWILKGRKGSAS